MKTNRKWMLVLAALCLLLSVGAGARKSTGVTVDSAAVNLGGGRASSGDYTIIAELAAGTPSAITAGSASYAISPLIPEPEQQSSGVEGWGLH